MSVDTSVTNTIESDQLSEEDRLTLEGFQLYAGLEVANPDWVAEMGLSNEHLISMKHAGLISLRHEEWIPYLTDHLWGVRRNDLDFLIRYAPQEVRLEMVRENRQHSLAGHLPEVIVSKARISVGLRAIYIAEKAVIPSDRDTKVFEWLEESMATYSDDVCRSHV